MITKTEIGNQPVVEGNKASSLVSKFYLCIVGYWKLTFMALWRIAPKDYS
jgi:hypothetical protein